MVSNAQGGTWSDITQACLHVRVSCPQMHLEGSSEDSDPNNLCCLNTLVLAREGVQAHQDPFPRLFPPREQQAQA